MARKDRQRFVIFARPEQHGRPGNRFIARDGTVTDSSLHAAKFTTWEDAKDFASEKGIKLDGVIRYIGKMGFSDADLRER